MLKIFSHKGNLIFTSFIDLGGFHGNGAYFIEIEVEKNPLFKLKKGSKTLWLQGSIYLKPNFKNL